MKENTASFWKKVFFTAFLSYTLISVFYLGLLALLYQTGETNATPLSTFQAAGYFLEKLFCVFLFSLALGFINRIPESRRLPRAAARLLHFFASFTAFALFMILLFYGIEKSDSFTARGVLFNIVLFLIFYFLTLGVTAAGRILFIKKPAEEYKSILD